jgi:uncharacterized membrane protein
MHWFPLALICALSLALADTASKKWLADRGADELTLIRFGLPGLLLAPILLIQGIPAPPPIFWAWLAAAMPLEIVAMLLYVRAIRDSPLSATLPYMAFTPVFTVATGQWLLGEAVSARGLFGILLVVLGAWGLNLEQVGRHPRTWLAPFRAIVRERGSRLMLMVAAIYSVTASSPVSPVRMRMTCSTVLTNILPSPILDVRAALTMASRAASSMLSAMTSSTLTLGRKSTTYSAPR